MKKNIMYFTLISMIGFIVITIGCINKEEKEELEITPIAYYIKTYEVSPGILLISTVKLDMNVYLNLSNINNETIYLQGLDLTYQYMGGLYQWDVQEHISDSIPIPPHETIILDVGRIMRFEAASYNPVIKDVEEGRTKGMSVFGWVQVATEGSKETKKIYFFPDNDHIIGRIEKPLITDFHV